MLEDDGDELVSLSPSTADLSIYETSSTSSSLSDTITTTTTTMMPQDTSSRTDSDVILVPLRERTSSASGTLRERTTSQTDVEMQGFLLGPSALHSSSNGNIPPSLPPLSSPSGMAAAKHGRSRRPSSHNDSSSHSGLTTNIYRHGRRRIHRTSHGPGTVLDWIQSRRVPLWLVRHIRRVSPPPLACTAEIHPTHDSHTDSSSTHHHESEIYWITGLDRVGCGHSSNGKTTTSSSCCAEAVRIAGVQPPRYLWYMLSGGICDTAQLVTLCVLHVGIFDSATCWCLAFVTTIPLRHVSHRHLVFGDYVGGYWPSLMRMYAGYSIIIVLSTLFNYVLSRLLPVGLLVLAVVTMLWSGVANYFILRYFWSVGSGGGGGVHLNTTTSGSTS